MAAAGVDRSFVFATVTDIIREGILNSVEDSSVKMENMDNMVADTVKGKDEEVRDTTNEDDTAARDTILAGVEATDEDSRVRCLERLEGNTARVAELEAEILEARLAVEAAAGQAEATAVLQAAAGRCRNPSWCREYIKARRENIKLVYVHSFSEWGFEVLK